MKLGEDLDTGRTIYKRSVGGVKPVLHLDPECQYIRRAVNYTESTAGLHPNRRICKECDPEHSIDHSPNRKQITCRACGEYLTPDGECPFCTRLEELRID